MPKQRSLPAGQKQPILQAAPHRNHGLFSDYYLDTTLPNRADWQMLGRSDAVSSVLVRLQEILRAYSPSANEAQTEMGLIKPVLDAIGHTHTVEVQASLATPGSSKKPDYVFYYDPSALEANKGKRLTEDLLAGSAFAVGDAKYWERPLDISKVSGDFLTNENPSSQIEFYIRYSGVPWGILTNGRLWRLYHKDSAKHLDRYYEVDLPALLDSGDPLRFLYFYAFFGRRAFDAGDLGVDALLRGSNEYARGVSDSLKSQVFDALRHLAQGFLDYRPNKLQTDLPTLKAIYDGSLIILYRVLFILYAEARDLLPIHASHQYRTSYSLDTIKREIQHGNVLLATTAMLWARLDALFQIIDAGSTEMGVPTYNGGLFNPERHQFIAVHMVGDYHLQQAIDKLARVAGQFVDYRDLQVRHLGTIYEGLLEYHLQPIDPAAGWNIDLLNDRGERKATGSYYTPDYIVSYMVEQALGPILKQAVEGVQDDAARIQAVLAVNILDMAMGSAHFLVEATEHLARFLVGLGVAAPDAQGEAELAYWRRRVAQTCIYGVDLNPLAVDLAKLSIWLITVAKDRPLSFLDHHLRTGNALVGTRLAALTQAAAGAVPTGTRKAKAAKPNQLVLFSGDTFRQSMSTAVDSMWLIEGSMGATVADVKEQERLYEELRRRLVGTFRTLANVLTAQHFGVDVTLFGMEFLTAYAMGRTLAVPKQLQGAIDAVAALEKEHAFFHWELEFPEVFFDRYGQPLGEAAGFDVVIGNPPYIRQEALSADKPYLAAAFPAVYHGVADLSVYFFAQALALLRPGGRTSFINSNSWLRANYATALRASLRTTATVERIIDLGDNRVFGDAPDVYPAIHVFTRAVPRATHIARTAVFVRGEGIRDFARQLARKEIATTIHDQPDSGWQLGPSAGRALFAKLMAAGRPLGDVVGGRMYYGIKTGLNEAFILDQATRDRLVADDPACSAVIKPVLRGEDLRPWYQEDEGRWLIVLPSGWTAATLGAGLSEGEGWGRLKERYPALAGQLDPFVDAARKRQDKGQFWWELRSCDYYAAFEQSKLLWPDIARSPRFSWDTSGYYLGNTGYIANTDQLWLLAFLASRCAWYLISRTAIALGERAGANRYRLIDQYMRPLPIPEVPSAEQKALAGLAGSLTQRARDRYTLHQRIRHRLRTDLGTADKALNQKLTAWWDLDFRAFRAEVQKVWKRDIPLKERTDWEDLLAGCRAEHARLTSSIVAAEGELNARVYSLFHLTQDEIKIVEESTTYRYGEV